MSGTVPRSAVAAALVLFRRGDDTTFAVQEILAPLAGLHVAICMLELAVAVHLAQNEVAYIEVAAPRLERPLAVVIAVGEIAVIDLAGWTLHAPPTARLARANFAFIARSAQPFDLALTLEHTADE